MLKLKIVYKKNRANGENSLIFKKLSSFKMGRIERENGAIGYLLQQKETFIAICFTKVLKFAVALHKRHIAE